jgi:hypothetical protein
MLFWCHQRQYNEPIQGSVEMKSFKHHYVWSNRRNCSAMSEENTSQILRKLLCLVPNKLVITFEVIIDTRCPFCSCNSRRLNTVSKNTFICESNMTGFVCYFEKSTNVLFYFLRQQLNYDCLKLIAIYKEKIKWKHNSKIKAKEIISYILKIIC